MNEETAERKLSASLKEPQRKVSVQGKEQAMLQDSVVVNLEGIEPDSASKDDTMETEKEIASKEKDKEKEMEEPEQKEVCEEERDDGKEKKEKHWHLPHIHLPHLRIFNRNHGNGDGQQNVGFDEHEPLRLTQSHPLIGETDDRTAEQEAILKSVSGPVFNVIPPSPRSATVPHSPTTMDTPTKGILKNSSSNLSGLQHLGANQEAAHSQSPLPFRPRVSTTLVPVNSGESLTDLPEKLYQNAKGGFKETFYKGHNQQRRRSLPICVTDDRRLSTGSLASISSSCKYKLS